MPSAANRSRAAGDAGQIPIARIGAAHGIKGDVRVKAYTEAPLSVVDYGPLAAPDGRVFVVETARETGGDMLVVRFKGIADRNTAETLAGIELSVPRERLPPAEEGAFYHSDLIGLAAVSAEGAPVGRVIAVQNYGAGDLLEIAPERGPTLFVPFTNAAVPDIDVAAGRLVVVPPNEIEAEEQPSEDKE